ncbi:eukaryotic translation initiation factor 4B3-like [Cornus florida]|uniref:eukaryotic translation initiation factor 4B3-like n=1 Tax=Cornus florida TaxID=4283 RepID=UPI00289F7C2B|nr:eukaryotic translation initiation factor 4B3-like [Cornus florida]
MAAAVSAWSKPGAWALDSEEHENELLQETDNDSKHFNGGDASDLLRNTAALTDFPSLSSVKTTKTKKKKGQTLSLAEFSTFSAPKAAQVYQAKGLTTEDLMMLPTGPRERTAEEMERSRGGGFKSYSSSRYSSRDESSNPRWNSSRGSDEPRRQEGFGRDSSRELAPSRADETDDWGASKKSSFSNGFERKERGERGGFFDSQSRADESESWVSNKSFVPTEGRRYVSSRGAFDGLRERRGGSENGGGPDSENWGKKKEEEGRKFGVNGGAFDSLSRERRGGFESGMNGGTDSDNWGKKREEFVGSERPKLNLQPRKLPVGDGQQNGTGSPAKPKASNPFGDARPREEVLKEKGQDWKEIDEKLESIKIKETTEGPSFGKRSFGSGNGRASFPEGRDGRSWRKPDFLDSRPSSADKMEYGAVEAAEGNGVVQG